MVEVAHLFQQRHLPDHEGRDSGFCRVQAKVQLLHRQEALFLPDLSGFVNPPEGAFSDLRQELVPQLLGAHGRCTPNSKVEEKLRINVDVFFR